MSAFETVSVSFIHSFYVKRNIAGYAQWQIIKNDILTVSSSKLSLTFVFSYTADFTELSSSCWLSASNTMPALSLFSSPFLRTGI